MNDDTAQPKVQRDDLLFPEETYKIKGACLAVHGQLGCGFLEKVYESALVHELRKIGLTVQQQVPIHVNYDGVIIGEYIADILVNKSILVEIKATERDNDFYKAQVVNYLKATGLQLGLLVNFGKTFFSFKRIVLT